MFFPSSKSLAVIKYKTATNHSRDNKNLNDTVGIELVKLVRKTIGPIAKINIIQWAPGLPKTRSGKIMRRILRKIAVNEIDALGDTSTLADPSVVDELIENRANR